MSIVLQCFVLVMVSFAFLNFSAKDRTHPQIDRWIVFLATYKPCIMEVEGVVSVDFSASSLPPRAPLTETALNWFLATFPSNISTIFLKDCDIGDASIELLCARNQIIEIDIGGTNVSEVSLLYLDKVETLKVVKLKDTHIAIEKLQAFQRRHRDWDIRF